MERDDRADRYTPETRKRAVRLVFEDLGSCPDRATAIGAIVPKIGCSLEALLRWVVQAKTTGGAREGVTAEERPRIRDLEREVMEAQDGLRHLDLSEPSESVAERFGRAL